ncbi:hypothetical protein MUP77_23505 [Candidatus Bathyarchaeota archaeon]|nr:hypothetical protein [Candidatus Bathyarchaeota archaeon]
MTLDPSVVHVEYVARIYRSLAWLHNSGAIHRCDRRFLIDRIYSTELKKTSQTYSDVPGRLVTHGTSTYSGKSGRSLIHSALLRALSDGRKSDLLVADKYVTTGHSYVRESAILNRFD